MLYASSIRSLHNLRRENTILSLDRLIASWLRMNFVTKADLKTKPRVRGGPTKRSTSSSSSSSSSSTVSVGIGDASTSQINAISTSPISTPPMPSSNVATTVPLKQQQQQPLSIQEKARIEREQRALSRDQTAATLKIQRRKKFLPHYTLLFCI